MQRRERKARMSWDVWKDPKPAPGPLALVQDFVNTRNYFHGGDLLGDAEEATARLAERGLLEEGERIDEEGLQRLLAFREGLRGLLSAHNGVAGMGPGSAEALNGMISSAPLTIRFDPDGRPALEPASSTNAAERVIGLLLVGIAHAEAAGDWKRLKACRNEGCRWAFYDASKNRSGRWCNMGVCGSRDKMRRYRKRKSGTP